MILRDSPVRREMWTVYLPSGRRATIASFGTRESAERQLAAWRVREAKGKRPDVIGTEGWYVAEDNPS